MLRRTLPLLAVVALCLTAAARPERALKWPSWLSIESPVSPYEPSTRGAVLLVHARAHQGGEARLTDLRGRAEGVVNGARRSVDLHFDSTPNSGVFALRRQWPAEGTWILRISFESTTAIVTLDRDGAVAFARVPTERRSGIDLPRAVSQREVDSTLAVLTSR